MADLKPIKATYELVFEPDMYLEYCEGSGEIPTQDGLLAFVEDDMRDDGVVEAYAEDFDFAVEE